VPLLAGNRLLLALGRAVDPARGVAGIDRRGALVVHDLELRRVRRLDGSGGIVLLVLEHALERLHARRIVGNLGFGHPIAYTDELAINVLHASGNRISDSLLNLLLD